MLVRRDSPMDLPGGIILLHICFSPGGVIRQGERVTLAGDGRPEKRWSCIY